VTYPGVCNVPRRRVSVDLFDDTADHLDTLAARLNTRRPETVRRALNCLDFHTGLTRSQRIILEDQETGESRIVWFL
jgi:predicted transcriptional regulator